MRKNLPITQHEVRMNPGTRLITTTDLQGTITYCNDEFVAISGYSREELVGQPHNVIRHPEMPPAVFRDMWGYLKDGKAWMGVVKNRIKNGDHYWVSAYVTPIRENGQIVGFESVRVEPTRKQVERPKPSMPGFPPTRRCWGWGHGFLLVPVPAGPLPCPWC